MNRRAFLKLTSMGAAGALVGFTAHGQFDRRLDPVETTLRTTTGSATKGDLLVVQRTGEVMLVTAVSGSVLHVTRGFGATAVSAVNTDDEVQVVGGSPHDR